MLSDSERTAALNVPVVNERAIEEEQTMFAVNKNTGRKISKRVFWVPVTCPPKTDPAIM